MWKKQERVGVAVSGGADSVYLLHHLRELDLNLTLLHVNHKLRGPESDADERFVQELAASLKIPVFVHSAHPADGNREQEARNSRYLWFRSLIAGELVERVALGHNQTDQAETVLFRFLRGAGTAGLSAIRPETTDGFVRPLLNLTRETIRESLRKRGISWREDSSNQSDRFARNRIRHSLLPQLIGDWNPSLIQTLSQTAEWALAEEAYWQEELCRLSANFQRDPPYLTIPSLDNHPAAVQRRLIRYAIALIKGDLRRIDFVHIEAVRRLRSGCVHLPGLKVERSFAQLRLGPALRESVAFQEVITPPGTIHLPGSALEVTLELSPAESVYNDGKHQLDWGRVSGTLELRYWHPGDQYRRVGRSNEDKLKFLFQKERIPIWERQRWPVLVCGNQILWTRNFGAAAHFARNPDTDVVLSVREKSNLKQ